MLNYIKLLVLGVVAVFALIAANYARDVAYMVHAINEPLMGHRTLQSMAPCAATRRRR